MEHVPDRIDAQAPAEPSAATSESTSGFRQLSRRISRRTTDLLAIAIVSLGVLSVSGRLTEWWRTDPNLVLPPAASANQVAGPGLRWGTGESAVSLLAGDLPVRIERRVLTGDQDRVDSLLRDRLVEVLESPPQPASHQSSPQRATYLQDREQRLLELLQSVEPIETRDGHWNLYRIDRKDNLFVGSFLIATRAPTAANNQPSLAGWALAVPSGSSQWTSFVMTPTGEETSTTSEPVLLPVDAEVVMSLRTPAGDELTVFRQEETSTSQIAEWTREISHRLTSTGWQQVRSWQQSMGTSVARFEQTRSSEQDKRLAIEFAIATSHNGRLTGTANVIAIPIVERQAVPVPGNNTSDRQKDS